MRKHADNTEGSMIGTSPTLSSRPEHVIRKANRMRSGGTCCFSLMILILVGVSPAIAQMNTNDLLEGFAIRCEVSDTREGKGIWYRTRGVEKTWERVSMGEAFNSKGYELAEVWSKDARVVLVLFEPSERNPVRTFTCYNADGQARSAIEVAKVHDCKIVRVLEFTFEGEKQLSPKARFYEENDTAPLKEVSGSGCAARLPRRSIIRKVTDLPFDLLTGN